MQEDFSVLPDEALLLFFFRITDLSYDDSFGKLANTELE